MFDVAVVLKDLSWPTTILLAWLMGEIGYRFANLPRISAYATVGFLLGPTQLGLLGHEQTASMLLLANIAFGLFLFECGYRINLRWARNAPWIVVTSIAESLLTFGAVFLLTTLWGLSSMTALLLAALSMAASPATILSVINERRSSGQVTERVLHSAATSCVLAVFVFKIILGLVIFRTSSNLADAVYTSFVALFASTALGLIFSCLASAILRLTGRMNRDGTVAYTIFVLCLVTLAHALKVSPILAALTFGLAARHNRVVLSTSQRGFGALGSLLSVLLFVFVAATIDGRQFLAGLGLGMAVIAVRQIAKVGVNGLLAPLGGISWRKGIWVGVAGAPISAFVILILEQSRYLGIDLVDHMSPLATVALTLEVLSPIVVQYAFRRAQEVPQLDEE